MAEQLGCRTLVAHPGTGQDPTPCGHLAGQHQMGAKGGLGPRGRCAVSDCGCPTYTPPEGHRNPPGSIGPVAVHGDQVGHHVDLVDPEDS